MSREYSAYKPAAEKLTNFDRKEDSNWAASTNTGPCTSMASDEDYAAFLEKANADPFAGSKPKASASGAKSGKIQLKTVDHGEAVPMVLKSPTEKEEWIYVSDADEPFVAVSLKLGGSRLPDEGL